MQKKKNTTSENRRWRENSESDIFVRMELWPLSRMFYTLYGALKFSWQCLLFRTVILQKRSLGLPLHHASCPASSPGLVWENMRLRAIKEYLSVGAQLAGKTGKTVFVFAFPIFLCAEPKSLHSLPITNQRESAWVRGSQLPWNTWQNGQHFKMLKHLLKRLSKGPWTPHEVYTT